jgi:ABC-type transport system substrate-binding protein
MACLVVAGGCHRADSPPRRPASSTTTTPRGATAAPADQAVDVPLAAGDRPRGGSVRVGVWDEADPEAPTLGGAAVRALVLPQLFVARPDGRWSPSLVAPGSDVTAPGATSATFRLRPGAVWSDGSPIGVEDLRRTADARFVASVEGPPGGAEGDVTVRFTAPLPGWRRLWSAQDSIGPPAAGVWGGPFVVASRTAGLETVLARNPSWWGAPAPYLDEVRLVLVPEATMARQLLAAGQLDVVMPLASTVRTPQLSAVPGVDVDRVERGGWSVVLVANPDRLAVERRRALFAAVDRTAFVSTLLAGEASVLQGFGPSPEDATWASVGVAATPSDLAPLRGSVDLAGLVEEPMTPLLHRSMQKRVRSATEGGATIELRSAPAPIVEGWLRDGSYGAAVAVWLDPLGGCWTCRWGGIDAAGAAAADAGDASAVASLENRLREEARVLPLWRPATVTAWRTAAVSGVRANGFGVNGAWNAWEWWRPPSAG